ncbi:MAG: hypothetical protein DWQ06_08515 [Calditrichaeota bacterium]|nr:MAG: hypothetical protein DWQ06_08515 [Calditrichota bacterium]
MFIPRHETEVLQTKLSQAIENGIGSTILISGEPGIGKTTLIKNFMDNCDKASEKNVLTAIGSCLDMDGVSRGFLPWREVLIELDADKAAGKDEEKKSNFKKIVKTVFDEAGSQWLEAIPVIGDISSAIFETAKTISKDEVIDIETGDSKKLALKDRLKNVAKECKGDWLNVIPVVGNLTAAIYKTTNELQKTKKISNTQNQQDFFIHVMSKLRELAESNPVVIYIDDLQWADISSMNLFFYIAKNLNEIPYPLVLIGSFRPQDVKDGRINLFTGAMEKHPWEEKIKNLENYGAAELLEVSYLNQSQISSYIELQFPQNGFSKKFKSEIVNLTKGNSLFVRELLLHLVDRKVIYEKDGKYFSDETLDLSTFPRTVSGIVEERFQRLSEDLQEVLQVASVQGSDFSLELIGTLLEENHLILNDKINDLQQKYSLILKSEAVYERLTKIYNFTHNLVQKYIYYQMNEDFRLELHNALAETLESFFEGDEIYKVAKSYSYHFGVSNGIIDENGKLMLVENQVSDEIINKYLDLQKVILNDLRTSYHNEEIINKYLELSNIYKIRLDKKSEIEAVLSAAHIYKFIGELDKGISKYERCLREAENEGLPKLIADSCVGLSKALINKNEYESVSDYLEKALKIYKEIGDKSKIANTVGIMGILYKYKNDYTKAMECYKEELKTCEEIGNQNGVAMAVGSMGVVHEIKGNFAQAMECFKKKLEISESIKNQRETSIANLNIGSLLTQKGDFTKAMEFYNKAIALSKEIEFKYYLCIQLIKKAELFFLIGEFSEAKTFNDEGIKIAEEMKKVSDIFKSKVLSLKLNFALGEKVNPPKQLLQMLAETEDKEEIVILNYELWKMTSQEKYKIEASKLYKELYSKTPKFDYKKKIEELEK